MLRFRQIFIAFSLLAYALLGGGPSLWALGLAEAPMGAACAGLGCSCKAGTHGAHCCCRFGAALLKKFPELAQDRPRAAQSCELRQAPLAPAEASDGLHALPSQQPHTLADAGLRLQSHSGFSFLFAAASGPLYYPEPPTPVPD